jgi:hypothetical protein
MINNIEMKMCPKFYRCSAPICPLDIDYKKRVFIEGDLECTLPRNKRMSIGKTLPNKGLTAKELGGFRGWKKIPLERQREIAKIGEKNLISL